MLIASYEQWKAEKMALLEEQNPMLECRTCSGVGEFHEICSCCGGETDRECDDCEGTGEVPYLEARWHEREEQRSRAAYFREVVSDLKAWCAFTRQDFLKVAGEFVSEFRKHRGRV